MIERRKVDSGGRRLNKGRRIEDGTDMKRSYILPHYAVTPAPAVPTVLAAVAISSSQINLSWVASAGPSLKDYGVYRQGAGLLGFVTGTSFSDIGLTAGTSYTYFVTARNLALVESAPSNFASATTQPISGLTHGQPFTLTGSGFSTRSGQTLLVRDIGNAPTGTVDPQWTLHAPTALTGNNNLQNQAVGFKPSTAVIGSPHSYVNAILAGCHLDTGNPSNEVEAGVSYTNPGYPHPLYASWYTRCNPDQAFGNGSPVDYNLKYINFNHGNQGEGQSLPGYYFAFDPGGGGGPQNNTTVSRSTINNATDIVNMMEQPDFNGHSHFWGARYSPFRAANGVNGWLKEEYSIGVTTATGNAGGYWNEWSHYNLKVVSYVGKTDNIANDNDALRALTWGSYMRDRGPNNYRFGADFYIGVGAQNDTNYAVVILGDNPVFALCTVREPQVSTSWADGTITCTCHKGALQAGPVWAHIQIRSGAVGPTIVKGPYTMN